jgi:hypothetical protein
VGLRPKFIADADLNRNIILGLRKREVLVDFLTAKEGGTIGRPDSEVLEIAARSGPIVVSHDRITMTAHFDRFVQTQVSPGLIIVPQGLAMGITIEELLMIWAASDGSEWLNLRKFLPL